MGSGLNTGLGPSSCCPLFTELPGRGHLANLELAVWGVLIEVRTQWGSRKSIAFEKRAGQTPRPSGSLSCGPLSVYGKPTMDLSVASVSLVSVPAPPSRESLPLTPSLEFMVSLLPPTKF